MTDQHGFTFLKKTHKYMDTISGAFLVYPISYDGMSLERFLSEPILNVNARIVKIQEYALVMSYAYTSKF